jgi:hypothetical protein
MLMNFFGIIFAKYQTIVHIIRAATPKHTRALEKATIIKPKRLLSFVRSVVSGIVRQLAA